MEYLGPFISIPAIEHGTTKQVSSSTSRIPLEWYGYKKGDRGIKLGSPKI
jgi:hypothetical protein